MIYFVNITGMNFRGIGQSSSFLIMSLRHVKLSEFVCLNLYKRVLELS